MMALAPSEPAITTTPYRDGRTRVDAIVDGHSVSRCVIVPLTLWYGRTAVRVDGIAEVATEQEFRHRGYARRVLEAAITRMRTGDAALSLLYGIADFYPAFGYATVGFDFSIRLNELARSYPMPIGWTARPFTLPDLPAAQALYDRCTAQSVGAAVRAPDAPIWKRLAETADPNRPWWQTEQHDDGPAGRDGCRVVCDADGAVAAYAWRGKGLNYVSLAEQYFPNALHIAEVVADGADAADAILAACRAWATEESARRAADSFPPYDWVGVGAQPDGAVAAAAQLQDAWSISYAWQSAGPLVRLLDTERLIAAVLPELQHRWRGAGVDIDGILHIRTELGTVSLRLSPAGVVVQQSGLVGQRSGSPFVVDLPHQVVARLALGGFRPDDLLRRLATPPSETEQRCLEALFPARQPYLHLPDRP